MARHLDFYRKKLQPRNPGVTVEKALSPIEEIKQLFYNVFGDDIEVLLPETKICYTCGGTFFWISKLNGHLYCAVCHPPASEEIVAGWVGKKDEKIELKEIFEKQGQVNYQKPICKWCLSGKFLNCPDCKERREKICG